MLVAGRTEKNCLMSGSGGRDLFLRIREYMMRIIWSTQMRFVGSGRFSRSTKVSLMSSLWS